MPQSAAGYSRGRSILPSVCLAVVLVGLCALGRVVAREWAGIGLHVDEAQYVVWSFEPSFGYFSKPPLIAWTIATARYACGESDLCVRLPAVVALSLAAGFVYLIGQHLYGPRVALWALALFLFAPLTAFLSWFATTDSLLMLAWSAALYGFVRAIQCPDREGQTGWWLVTGVASGLGLLAKYTMGWFALCALVYLATSRRYRHLLAQRNLWMGVASAAALLTPNLLWNARHGYPTLAHTAEISHLDRISPSLLRALDFSVEQFAVFGPAVLGIFILALPGLRGSLGNPLRSESRTPDSTESRRLLIGFSLPVLLFVLAQAWLARAHANWAAPALVATTLLTAAWLVERSAYRLLAVTLGINVLLSLGLIALRPGLAAAGAPAWLDPFTRVAGWDRLGHAVSAALDGTPPGTRLVADERGLLSQLIVHAGPRARDALIWNPSGRRLNHYHLSRDISREPCGRFLFVSESDRSAELREAFEHVRAIGPLQLPPAERIPQRRVLAWEVHTPTARPAPAHPPCR